MSSNAQASSSKSSAPLVKLHMDIDRLGRMKPAKVFSEAVNRHDVPVSPAGSSTPDVPPQIISLAFDDTGEKCLTAGEDEGFVIWDARKARKVKNFYSKKYGIGVARFSHKGNIIHSSTKFDDAIRYQSPHDNVYLAYFAGHTGKVRSIHVNPHNDEFVSAGDDGTVRCWDTRQGVTAEVGKLNDVGGSTIAAFDSMGLVFAVACSTTQSILLYDRSTMDSGPFSNAALIDTQLLTISSPPPKPIFTSISFSNNGAYILVGTNYEAHYLLDAYDLKILRRLIGHSPLGKSSGEEVCFTSDSRYVLSGSADGSICIWDLGKEKIETGAAVDDASHPSRSQPAATLTPTRVVRAGSAGETQAVSRAVRINPRYGMMAVGGEELSFWLPAKDDDALVEQGF